MSAQRRGWGPPIPYGDRRLVVAEAGGIRLRVHKDVEALFEAFIRDITGRGYDVDDTADDWGHAYRLVRGSKTVWSNHSWGLAIDLNATRNPMAGRLITDMPSWISSVAAQYGLRWGGDYRTRPDAMHFEFLGTPAQAAQRVASLKRHPAAVAGQVPVRAPGMLQPGDTGAKVVDLQRKLAAVGFDVGTVDGEYGARTRAAVAAFQRLERLAVDGVAGPQTLRVLEDAWHTRNEHWEEPTMLLIRPRGKEETFITDGLTARRHVGGQTALGNLRRAYERQYARPLQITELPADDELFRLPLVVLPKP